MVENKTYFYLSKVLDLQVNPLKLANLKVSCLGYLDCILFQIGGLFWFMVRDLYGSVYSYSLWFNLKTLTLTLPHFLVSSSPDYEQSWVRVLLLKATMRINKSSTSLATLIRFINYVNYQDLSFPGMAMIDRIFYSSTPS